MQQAGPFSRLPYKSKVMKTDTSLNLMLVVFCAALLGFIFLSNRLHHHVQAKQLMLEKPVNQ